MAQQIHDHFSPIRHIKRIDTKSDTSIADGPEMPSILIGEWWQQFGGRADILKMRILASFDSGNGKTISAKETANTQGLQDVQKMTKKAAFRSGGDFIGALFNV